MSRGRVFQAATVQQGPVPAYEIVEVQGKFTTQRSYFDEKTRSLEQETIVHDGGFMVNFPRGHSLYYPTLEALQKATVSGEPIYQDMVELVDIDNHDNEMNSDHDDKKRLVPTPVKKQS